VLHGALLDAEILADVYLAMTGGQTTLSLDASAGTADGNSQQGGMSIRRLSLSPGKVCVLQPTESEWEAHRAKLARIRETAGECAWESFDSEGVSS
jgi:DNA polymerase-3 subunit epsilon